MTNSIHSHVEGREGGRADCELKANKTMEEPYVARHMRDAYVNAMPVWRGTLATHVCARVRRDDDVTENEKGSTFRPLSSKRIFS